MSKIQVYEAKFGVKSHENVFVWLSHIYERNLSAAVLQYLAPRLLPHILEDVISTDPLQGATTIPGYRESGIPRASVSMLISAHLIR
jgi:hypothetical protein